MRNRDIIKENLREFTQIDKQDKKHKKQLKDNTQLEKKRTILSTSKV